MIKKVINSIKNGNILASINSRLRIVWRIKNRNVYSEHIKCKEYEKLKKKYNILIRNGVNENLNKEKSNKIWICWLQGIENAPDIVKACINSIKKSMSKKEIILLTSENLNNYVKIPEIIKKKVEAGIIPLAQFTDIIRTEVLCSYGGGWIDSTVLCTADKMPDYIENSKFFVYQQLDLHSYKKDLIPIKLSNWLIFSESNNPILLLTLQLLYKYWEDHNRLTNYFIYHLFFTMATERYPDVWKNVPVYNNHSPHTMQQEIMNDYSKVRWEQLKKISDFHKLNRRMDYSNFSNSLFKYILQEYLDK